MLRRGERERLNIADDPTQALEQCEDELLDMLSSPPTFGAEAPLSEQRLLRGLTAAELQAIAARVTRRSLRAGREPLP